MVEGSKRQTCSETEIVSTGQHFQKLIIFNSALFEEFVNFNFCAFPESSDFRGLRFREFTEPFPDIVNSAILNIRLCKKIRKHGCRFCWFSQDFYSCFIDYPEHSGLSSVKLGTKNTGIKAEKLYFPVSKFRGIMSAHECNVMSAV